MSELQRYGLEWKSETDFVCHPMADGYWTPWHIATEENTRLQSEVERLRGRCEDALSCLDSVGGKAELAISVIRAERDERLNSVAEGFEVIKDYAEKHAQHLRQQAAESEGGDDDKP